MYENRAGLGYQNFEEVRTGHTSLQQTELLSEGFAPHQIRKYGFAFRGKECLIG